MNFLLLCCCVMVFPRSNAVLDCQKYFRVLLRCMLVPNLRPVLLTSRETSKLNVYFCHTVVVVFLSIFC